MAGNDIGNGPPSLVVVVAGAGEGIAMLDMEEVVRIGDAGVDVITLVDSIMLSQLCTFCCDKELAQKSWR